MLLSLSGEINYKSTNKLIDALNKLDEKDNILKIYFSFPEGGYVDSTQAIISLINENCSKIEMIFYGELFSGGMIIFLNTKCKKTLLPNTTGMYHFAWQNMAINETGKPNGEYDCFTIKEFKESKKDTIEFLKTTKLNSKEITNINKGKDQYFSYKRMLELL